MMDSQETNQAEIIVARKVREDPETILNNLRIKVPPFHDTQAIAPEDAIRPKIDNLLRGYGGKESRPLVRDLLARTIAIGCSSFGINPDELIISPGQLQKNQIAAAGVKRIGTLMLKKLMIDPTEVAFRDDLVSRYGVGVSKNITDLLFVTAHEMTHLGQAIYAGDEYEGSKEVEYPSRPTEKHANETGLAFCRQLLAATKRKEETDDADEILLRGLPETIAEVQVNGRPRL